MITKRQGMAGIVIATITGLLVCFAGAIALSLTWPSNWNAMVGSLLLSILTTLIGVLVAVLTAIFVVETYLEKRRREAEKISAAEKERYRGMWQAYLNGGVSIVSAVITHLSLFIAYGRSRYLELVQAEGDTSDVPNTIGTFTVWLVDAMYEERRERKATSPKGSRGMGEEAAGRLMRAFETGAPLELSSTKEDLEVLLHYLGLCQRLLSDQVFLFQPFMNVRMGLAVALVTFSRSITFSIDDTRRSLAVATQSGRAVQVDKKMASGFCVLGLHAVKVAQMMWAKDDIKELVGVSVEPLVTGIPVSEPRKN